MEPDQAPESSGRPFWQWLAIALAPGIVSNVLAVFARAVEDSTSGVTTLAVAGIMLLLAMPILMVPYLIVLSKPYLLARGSSTTRTGFVIGFWFVNMFLWGASCGVVLSGIGFH